MCRGCTGHLVLVNRELLIEGPQVAMSACKLSIIDGGGHCSSADWSVPHADHDWLGAVRKQFVSLAATWKAVPRLLQHVANKSGTGHSTAGQDTTHHTPVSIHHSSYTTRHTPLNIHHSSFITCHTPLILQDSSYIVSEFKTDFTFKFGFHSVRCVICKVCRH